MLSSGAPYPHTHTAPPGGPYGQGTPLSITPNNNSHSLNSPNYYYGPQTPQSPAVVSSGNNSSATLFAPRPTKSNGPPIYSSPYTRPPSQPNTHPSFSMEPPTPTTPTYTYYNSSATHPSQQQSHPHNSNNSNNNNPNLYGNPHLSMNSTLNNNSHPHNNNNNNNHNMNPNTSMGGMISNPKSADHGNYSYGSSGSRRVPVHNRFHYNQLHHAASNNAVPEKTPTIRFRHPATGETHCIKLNRIYSTEADFRSQLPPALQDKYGHFSSLRPYAQTQPILCLEFLHQRQGCPRGVHCDKLHIAGLEYTWFPIVPTVRQDPVAGAEGLHYYSQGFHICCYDSTLTHYYKIPSECLLATHGSEQCIDTYNEHGENSKLKFKLHPFCDQVNQKYSSGAYSAEEAERSLVEFLSQPDHQSLSELFCLLPIPEEVPHTSDAPPRSDINVTHVNNEEAMQNVRRLPAEMIVRVFETNSREDFNDYPGSVVLLTDGAVVYQNCYESEGGIPLRKNMQHCAHFHMKNVCRLGMRCRFIHVVQPQESKRASQDDREPQKW